MKTLVTLAAAAVAFSAIPCQAQSPADGTVLVPYGDLNLASASGAAALERRIKAAANRICGTEQAPGLAETLSVQGCRDDVFESARPQISKALAMNGSGSVSLAASR